MWLRPELSGSAALCNLRIISISKLICSRNDDDALRFAKEYRSGLPFGAQIKRPFAHVKNGVVKPEKVCSDQAGPGRSTLRIR
jgi:hypothetical protein